MEQDNQQFSTQLLKKNPSLSRIIKWTFFIFVFICLILIGIMLWLIIRGNKTQTVTPVQQIVKETGAVLSQAKLTFPKIITLIPLADKDFPAEMQFFSLTGATGQVYNTIQYENGKIGYQSAYMLPNFTIEKFIAELPKQIALSKIKSPWVAQEGSVYTNSVGYIEFLNNTSTAQVRVTFLQQDNNLRVVVQGLNGK